MDCMVETYTLQTDTLRVLINLKCSLIKLVYLIVSHKTK